MGDREVSAERLKQVRDLIKGQSSPEDKQAIEKHERLSDKDQLLSNIDYGVEDICDTKIEASFIGVLVSYCEEKNTKKVNDILSRIKETDLHLRLNKLMLTIINDSVINNESIDKALLCRRIKARAVKDKDVSREYRVMGEDNYVYKNVPLSLIHI